MAKLLFIKDNGESVVLREDLCDNDQYGVLIRSDYIASKLWMRDDVIKRLRRSGFKGTEEEVNAVMNTGILKGLGDCTDDDWQIIDYAISFADLPSC